MSLFRSLVLIPFLMIFAGGAKADTTPVSREDLLSSVSAVAREYSDCPQRNRHAGCREQLAEWASSDRETYSRYMACRHLRRNERREGGVRCRKVSDDRYRLTGHVRYRGLVPLPFRYDVVREGEKWIVEVKIFFNSPLIESHGEAVDQNLAQAARYWSTHSPVPGAEFRFVRVPSRSEAHFTVGFKEAEAMSILYLHKWSTGMQELPERDDRGVYHHTYAHEIGHMLGLDDEYHHARALTYPGYFLWTDGVTADCDPQSLMCMDQVKFTTAPNRPQNYHYSLILGRLSACED